jgi:hypothetical protein
MNDTGDIPQKCQENIQPEGPAKSHLEKNAERWQNNRNHNSNQIHYSFSIFEPFSVRKGSMQLFIGSYPSQLTVNSIKKKNHYFVNQKYANAGE